MATPGAGAGDLEARLSALEDQVRRLEAVAAGAQGEPGPGRFAALYPAFQDRFRGSREEITERLRAYLPDVRRVAGAAGVVDLGPGRGEWLSLLREHGVKACGVEENEALFASCVAQGLDVVFGDGVEHLQALPAGSADMVTAFHVIEHLDVEQLLALLEGAARALRPGGCLLLETPNPENLVMGACDFWGDPTHRAPLPPVLTEYLVGAHGFSDVEVRRVHPGLHNDLPPVAHAPTGSPGADALVELVRARFAGPQDYAVLGHRAHTTLKRP